MKSGYLREGAWATIEPSMRQALAIARAALNRLVSSDARLGQLTPNSTNCGPRSDVEPEAMNRVGASWPPPSVWR